MGKGANGQTIIREVVTPKNPRTESQLVQRIIMKTVMQAYSTMKAITDHSFEGIAPGAATMAEFMRRNLNAVREKVASALAQGYGYDDIWAFTPLKSEIYSPNEYIISKGSLPVVPSFIGSTYCYIDALGANTYQEIINKFGLQRGDQLTFVTIQGTTPARTQFYFVRVILDPRNADGTEAPLSSTFVGADNKINLPNPRNEGEFLTLTYTEGQVRWNFSGQERTACGIITSRRDGESWLRSNCTLASKSSSVAGFWPTLGECLSMLESGDIETRSKLYLNNAGTGRTAQAESTNTIVHQTAAGVTKTFVGIDFVTGQSTDAEPVSFPAIPVVVDSEGNKYYIKNSVTDGKYYEWYLVDNTTWGMEGAWGQLAGATNANTVLTGDVVQENVFLNWLFAAGISLRAFMSET